MVIRDNLFTGMLAIVAGILILAFQNALQWIVGGFLIIWCILSVVKK